MSKVSVIIPAYNVENTILQTVESVLKQTYVDFELIIINDGSSDRTLDIVNTIHDPRITIHSFENGGLPTARNRGIIHATGEYLTFLDADDLWTPDKLEQQVAALEADTDAGVVYSWTLTMSADGRDVYPGKSPTFAGNVYADLLLNNFIASGSNVMIRREAIASVGGFDPSLQSCEDWDYWLRLAKKWPFALVRKPHILYRQTVGSMSSKVSVIETNHFIVHDRAFAEAPPELQYLEPQSRCRHYQYLTQLSLRHAASWHDITFAIQRFKRAVKTYPPILFQKKTYVLSAQLLCLILLTPTLGKQILRVLSSFKASKPPTTRIVREI